MIRALTIRFAIMCVGQAPLIWAANHFKPAPGIVMASLIMYVLAGSILIGRYCIAHEDEIPTREQRRRARRG